MKIMEMNEYMIMKYSINIKFIKNFFFIFEKEVYLLQIII